MSLDTVGAVASGVGRAVAETIAPKATSLVNQTKNAIQTITNSETPSEKRKKEPKVSPYTKELHEKKEAMRLMGLEK